ncbi:MAG TPA: transposase [Dissulfurispiraceae bacterium]
MHYRRSVRLKGYDYSQRGAYFITICAHSRECLFGDVVDGEIRLSDYGHVVEKEWMKTADIRQNIYLDCYMVMPNHFHGIVVIDDDCRGTARRAPTEERFAKPVAGSLPTIMRSFNSAVTKNINEIRNTPGVPVWQRNYYEHVIRNDDEMNHIREYIVNNPARWAEDEENPGNVR